MTEVLWILTGSASAFAGVLLGRRMGRREVPPPPEKPSLICGCEHELSYHDPKTSECHGPGDYENQFKGGKWMSVRAPCACRQYTGARPLETYWAPPIYQEED